MSVCVCGYLICLHRRNHLTATSRRVKFTSIEEGRHKKLSLQERICQLCKVEVEDEKHFVMYCSKLEACRKPFFDKVNDICPMFNSMDTSDKFKFIMKSKDYDLNVLCVSFISELYNERNMLVNC